MAKLTGVLFRFFFSQESERDLRSRLVTASHSGVTAVDSATKSDHGSRTAIYSRKRVIVQLHQEHNEQPLLHSMHLPLPYPSPKIT
jgi:hypothetical protein